MERRPGFLKFYLPNLGKENQKIPPAFIQQIKGKYPMTVALRDRYSNLWLVKVEEDGGHWYFTDGWRKFMKENRVNGGDMVVYECFSKALFDFRVHDGSGCNTRGAGGPIMKLQSINFEPDESDDESDCETISIHDEEIEQHDHHQGEKVMDDDTDDNDGPTTEEENRVDDHPQAEQVKNVNQERTQQEGRRDDNSQPELVRGGEPGTSSSCKRKAKRHYDWYGVEVFRTGHPQPKNPYFVTKRRSTRANELYIPNDVIEAYNLNLPDEVLLVDPEGRKFRATRKVWSDKRTLYVGGWRPLCRVHNVGDKDFCICEFVQNDDGFCINVSFFPPKRR